MENKPALIITGNKHEVFGAIKRLRLRFGHMTIRQIKQYLQLHPEYKERITRH